MVFVLIIATGWIAIALLCWGACALAARGDGRETGEPIARRKTQKNHKTQQPQQPQKPQKIQKPQNREGLVVWEGLPELRVNVKDATPIVH